MDEVDTSKSSRVPEPSLKERDALEHLFNYAIKEYEEARKEHGVSDDLLMLSIDLESPVYKPYLCVLIEFFKRDDVYPFLDLSWKDEWNSVPWSRDRRIEQMLEELCSWIGVRAFFREADATPKKAVQKFFDCLGKASQNVTYIPILQPSFDSQIESGCSIKLGPHVSLVGLTSSLRELLLWNANMGSQKNAHRLFGCFALEIVTPIGSTINQLNVEVTSQINNFRILLRSLFGGSLYAPLQLHGRRSSWHPWRNVGGAILTTVENRRGCYLSRYSFMELKRCCEINVSDELKRYALTVDRLDQAAQRSSMADRILDLAIALESLFDGESELSYRYATNCAAILEVDPDKRVEIYSLIKGFYKARSLVAHGKDPNVSSTVRAFGKNRTEVETKLSEVATLVERLLKLHVLNPGIRTNEGKTMHLLKASLLNIDPTEFGR